MKGIWFSSFFWAIAAICYYVSIKCNLFKKWFYETHEMFSNSILRRNKDNETMKIVQ